jgi:hypothetical protein
VDAGQLYWNNTLITDAKRNVFYTYNQQRDPCSALQNHLTRTNFVFYANLSRTNIFELSYIIREHIIKYKII